MVKCKKCGYKFDYTGHPCVICGSDAEIDQADVQSTSQELLVAIARKNTAKIHSCRHLLADAGDTESEREYARLLEKGDLSARDIDTAMDYYRKAAEKNDPFSAFRYSRLVRRSSEEHGRFWLKYAAVLGAPDAYPEVSELFTEEGNEPAAAYYCALAAACDDTVSIVNMARRWFDGIGLEQNASYAKWYLDKLSVPPINAIKLAYKLRSVSSSEPPKPHFPDYTKYLRLLMAEAKRLGFFSAYYNLASTLAKDGDINAITALGILLIEGKGCKRDTERGISYLNTSIERGNPAAALYLAEAYLCGEALDKNRSLAMNLYEKAAKLGYPAAYEKLGDLYSAGAYIERDIKKAIEFYEMAAAFSTTAREKGDKLKETREALFLDSYRIINLASHVSPEEAFSAFKAAAIATAMGDARASVLLAKCYYFGFGTDADKRSAFFWYKNAADSSVKDAFLPVGLCYSRGIGVAFSLQNAVRYLKLAAEAGAPGALEELELLYKRKTKKLVRSLYSQSVELLHSKKFAEAVKILSSLERLAYPKALYTLGCLYEFGKGVPKSDRMKAELLYKKAYIGNSTFGNFEDPHSDYKLKILKLIR